MFSSSGESTFGIQRGVRRNPAIWGPLYREPLCWLSHFGSFHLKARKVSIAALLLTSKHQGAAFLVGLQFGRTLQVKNSSGRPFFLDSVCQPGPLLHDFAPACLQFRCSALDVIPRGSRDEQTMHLTGFALELSNCAMVVVEFCFPLAQGSSRFALGQALWTSTSFCPFCWSTARRMASATRRDS